MKIVSLLPSATEIVCALGLRDQLVAISHECDFPADVTRLPKATTTVIGKHQSSAAIDRDVRQHLSEYKALYSLNVPVLTRLAPDLLVTQALCDVCAVSADEVDRVACELPGKPAVLNLEPMSLGDVFATIRAVGEATGRQAMAEKVCGRMQLRMERVQRIIAARARHRPRVAFLEWIDPPFNGGHWTPELIELAGGIDVFAGGGAASRTLEWQEILAARPDVLFVACCGYSRDAAGRDLQFLNRQPGWAELPCVTNDQVFVADGNQFFNRPGPRLADSLEVLAQALHPDIGLPDPAQDRAIRAVSTPAPAAVRR